MSTATLASPGCQHLDEITNPVPSGTGCVECLANGTKWVHLRVCLICGHVGCCDSSEHKHATAHFHETGHPLVQSFEPGEDFIWCYVDQLGMEPNGFAHQPPYEHPPQDAYGRPYKELKSA